MVEPNTLAKQVALYSKLVSEDNIKIINVERETLWQRALIFYKATPHKDLYKRLSVTFEGYENAVDAGALRIEFFSDLMHQKGPGMPTLASYVYEFISSGEKSKAVALITEDDLPGTPQNKDLSDFLKKVHYSELLTLLLLT